MNNPQGQSLIEVVLVTFLFGVLGTGLLSTLLSSSFISSRGVEYSLGSGYIQEAIEAVRSIRNRDWSELVNGTHGLTTVDGYYDFFENSDSLNEGKFTRTITIEDVYRTASLTGDIAESGVLDAATKRVTVNVTWEVPAGLTKNIDSVFYVTNWDQESWIQTLTEDFQLGFENSTTISTNANGEVVLRSHDANWDQIEILHEINLTGGGDRVAIFADPDADILYTLSESNGGNEFSLLDMSDVSENTPAVIASYGISSANDFAVQNGYAYIAADQTGPGAEVIILQVPTMTLVATLDLPGSAQAQGVYLNGDTLVVVRAEDGSSDELVFYNISDPYSPTLLGGVDLGISLNDVVFDGTNAFAISGADAQEVTVVRISDFSVIETLDLTGHSDALAIDWFGDFLYVGKDQNPSGFELAKIDMSSPASLLVTSTLEVGARVDRLQVDTHGEYAVVATSHGDKEFFVINLSDFSEANSGDAYGSSAAKSSSVFGGNGYIGSASDTRDVTVFHVSPGGWGSTSLVSSVNLSGNHDESSVWVDGHYVYMATENNGANVDFFIYDISTPINPTYLGSLDTHSDINDVLVYGNYAYIATKDNSEEFMVIDISTKTSPVKIASYNASGSADGKSLTRVGNTIFLGRLQSSAPELYAIDISNPVSPISLGSAEYDSDLRKLVSDSSNVYAATSSGSEELAVFDALNPAMMSQIGSLNLSGGQPGRSIALSGSLLAIGRDDDREQELVMIDVSSPNNPQYLGGIDVPEEVSGIAFENGAFVHISTDASDGAYRRYNVTDPANPILDISFDLESEGKGIFFNGVYAFVATEDNASELKIIGPGSVPTDYTREGNFTSQGFDAGSDVSWDSLEWTVSGTGSVVFRIRSADTQGNLSTAQWVGPDGTPNSAFTVWGSSIVTDPSASGHRWFQWKASLVGDGATTPVLEDVTVRYSQ